MILHIKNKLMSRHFSCNLIEIGDIYLYALIQTYR